MYVSLTIYIQPESTKSGFSSKSATLIDFKSISNEVYRMIYNSAIC